MHASTQVPAPNLCTESKLAMARARAGWLGLMLLVLLSSACQASDGGGNASAVSLEEADAEAPTAGRNADMWLEAPYVVLVSFDGFAASYMHNLRPPEMLAMAEAGVWAREGMIPVYPIKTFPNHYSLATGVYPAKHGIVANTFYDPDRDETYRIGDRDKVENGEWYQAEPIWVTAERQGMVAASFFWVGSEADVMGVRPSYWRRFDERITNASRIDQVVEWLSYPDSARPHLITLYFSMVDGAGHEFGPSSPEVAEAVAEADALVKQLREGLASLPHADQVNLIITADHGMDGYTADNIEYLEDALGSLDGIRVAESGPNGNLFVDGGGSEARRVRDAINQGLGHVTAYLTEESPARLHYRGNPRIGDVIVLPDSGWAVFPRNDRPARGSFTHGWDNQITSMRALFMAEGPGLADATLLEPFENVQVYPLVTRLLGLEPAEGIDGSESFWDQVAPEPGA